MLVLRSSGQALPRSTMHRTVPWMQGAGMYLERESPGVLTLWMRYSAVVASRSVRSP